MLTTGPPRAAAPVAVSQSIIERKIHLCTAGTTTASSSIKADSGGAPAALSPDWPKSVIHFGNAMPPAKPSAAQEARDKATKSAPAARTPFDLDTAPLVQLATGAGALSPSSSDRAAPAAAQAPMLSSSHGKSSSSGRAQPQAAAPGASLKPEAVCSANRALNYFPVTRFASMCRAYLYTSATTGERCTAWFVDNNHVALAGHCVAVAGSGTYNLFAIDGAYGQVCCSPDSSDSADRCASDARFAVIGAVATDGWRVNGLNDNDGAVLKVQRFPQTSGDFGVPVSWGSMRGGFCDSRSWFYGGFPAQDTANDGCNLPFNARFVYSYNNVAPLRCTVNSAGTVDCEAQCSAGSGSSLLGYQGSSCPGMSGGPLVDYSSSVWYYYGILTRSYVHCSDAGGGSKTILVPVTENTSGAGANIAQMINALP